MTIEKVVKNVVVGIRIDSHSRELLSWALVKVAEPGDCVVAIHVCRSSDQAKKNKPLLDGYLQDYEGLCNVKKVDLTGRILTGSSVRKVLVREAKNWSAVAVVVGTSKHIALGGWSSIARYCAKRLPSTSDVLAIQSGKVVFRRCSSIQQPGLKGDTRPSFSLTRNASLIESRSEFGESEAETEMSSFEVGHGCIDDSRDGSEDSRGEILGVVHEHEKVNPIPISLSTGDLQEQKPGWPLLRRASASPQVLHPRRMSVVQWVMSLPDRSPQQFSTITESQSEEEISGFVDKRNNHGSSESGELPKDLDLLLKTNCKWFSYEVLKALTSQFSTENLIGKGGSNRVYKGILQDGKPVAVKTLKSSKEARNDFAHEVDIISSLKHKHITPLLGVCIQDNNLISVYNFLSKGSLEENLHGNKKEKSVLSWEVRFNVAVGIAEALNYLHTECSRPVIHRDVKSSNILLSNVFEPQLSDFGLAIWGPTTSSFLTQSDVVGTFGYLAPEYFMYGKVSDKIDVYAFGIVLLELLSGRKPISYETTKGQESLVMWAKPIIDSGDVRSILDPNLDGNFDEAQMQRMVIAAALCITRSARLRPKMSQILKLLRGFMDLEKYVKSQDDQENSENQDDNDDEVYPDSSAESHLGLALLDVNDDSTSLSSMDPNNSLSPEEFFKGRWSRSSSFD